VIAAIDSGATHPFFLKSSAADAGIDLSRGRDFMVTFGGSATIGRVIDCHLRLHDHRLKASVVFVDDIKLGYALLGRTGVFGTFNEVVFLERTLDKRVELRF